MKYQVKLKSTVTAWVDVEIDPDDPEITIEEAQEWAADDAVAYHQGGFQARLAAAGLEFGPIELAHEELDESVRTEAEHLARLAAQGDLMTHSTDSAPLPPGEWQTCPRCGDPLTTGCRPAVGVCVVDPAEERTVLLAPGMSALTDEEYARHAAEPKEAAS